MRGGFKDRPGFQSSVLCLLATEHRKLLTFIPTVLKEAIGLYPVTCHQDSMRAELTQSEQGTSHHCCEFCTHAACTRGGVHSHTQPVASAQGMESSYKEALGGDVWLWMQESVSGITVTSHYVTLPCLSSPLDHEHFSEMPGIVNKYTSRPFQSHSFKCLRGRAT